MPRLVIIGNGVAGASAAQEIRKADPKAAVTIFSAEEEPFYYRPRLPELIAGSAELAQFTLHDDQWHREREITLHRGERVTRVDLGARRVDGDQGHEEAFDGLLLATGADPFIPPVPGWDLAGVFALRSAADARAIRKRAQQSAKAILVGGGLLGLEAGAALTKLGLEVQVVEMFDRLLPRQMDPRGAAKLQGRLEAMGFSFFLGAKAKEIAGQKRAEGMLLDDGRRLEAGLILFSAGIRPRLDLARSLGLEVDKGVQVDDRMATSADGVWAAGDLVEHRGRIYGIWPAAQEQGRVAGANMAGGDRVYQRTAMSNTLKVVGIDLTSAGEIDPEGKLESAIHETDDTYRKVVFQGDKIAGFIFLGQTEGVKECQRAMEKGTPLAGLKGEMSRADFDFDRLSA